MWQAETLNWRRIITVELKSKLGEAILKNIGKSGMSQSELARRSGYSREHVRRIIQGESGASVEAVDAIATVIGADIDAFRLLAGHAPRQREELPIDEPGFKDIPVVTVDHKGRIESVRTLEQELIMHMSEDIREMKRSYDTLCKKLDLILEKVEAKETA